ncbi:MAG: hypothetical protein QG604_35 [Candidatus Dependentiae bacterium]|nr:hypothetical protein [Candidatus Dependentiae bacterium]
MYLITMLFFLSCGVVSGHGLLSAAPNVYNGRSAHFIISLPDGVVFRHVEHDAEKKIVFIFPGLSMVECIRRVEFKGDGALFGHVVTSSPEGACFSLDLRQAVSPVVTVMRCRAPYQVIIGVHDAPVGSPSSPFHTQAHHSAPLRMA